MHDWTAWWAGELERPLLVMHVWEPPAAPLPEAPGFTSNLPMALPAEEAIARYTPYVEATRYYADAWPKWWPNFGPGIIAGFLGARTIVRELGGKGLLLFIHGNMSAVDAAAFQQEVNALARTHT